MKTIIIDDESNSRELLAQIINEYTDDVLLDGEAGSVESAVTIINQNKPDIVFLDVELPDGSGFDILKKLKTIDFEVIFATGFDKYAINAIKFNCIDFILKPFEITDVQEAIEKSKARISDKNLKSRINNLLKNLQHTNQNQNKIVLPTQDGLEFILVNDIIRLEAAQAYTWIYLKDQSKILSSRYLKEFESILEDYPFYRIHRAHIINLNHISKYKNADGGQVVMSDNSIVDVSRRKKDDFISMLSNRK